MNSQVRGPDLSSALGIWKKHAESELRIWLMEELDKQKLGLPEVENYSLNLGTHFKSRKFKNIYKNQKNEDSVNSDIIFVSMKIKLKDEKEYFRELSKEKDEVRKRLADEYKKNSKTYRSAIKKLRIESTKVREETKEKII